MTVRDKQTTTTTTTVIRPQKHLFSYFRTFCVLAYYRRGPERNEKVKSDGKKLCLWVIPFGRWKNMFRIAKVKVSG